jgi:hypothetical protein
MMKCEKCNWLIRTSYEYGEYACELFGDEPPGFLDTGDGCKLRWNEAKKLSHLGDSVHYGTYQWYGRTPTNEEVEHYAKKLKAYNDYWEHIRKKYGVEVE